MHTLLIAIALLGPAEPVDRSARVEPVVCSDLASCEARLMAMASAAGREKHGPAQTGSFELAEAFAAVDGAVPRLVDLISHPDDRVAELAAIALRESPRIDEVHLPALKAGLDRGLGWLPPALAAVPGEAAVQEAVVRYLVSDSAPHNQEAYALERMGARAIPALLEASRCPQGCDFDTWRRLVGVFDLIGEPLSGMTPALLARAGDPATAGDVAALQLALIGAIGSATPEVGDGLLRLRESKPELAGDVDDALVAIRAPAAGQVLAARLRKNPGPDPLYDAARLGEVARDAAPVIVELTQHDDAEIRMLALSALAKIGGDLAIEALVRALDDERDLRQPWLAARALGRLQAVQARGDLERVAENHAFPEIREAATTAIAWLDLPQAPPDPTDELEGMGLLEFEYPGLTLSSCGRPDLEMAGPDRHRLSGPTHHRRLEKLAYDAVELSYGAGDEEAQRAKDPDAVIEVHPGNILEHRTKIRPVPDVALRVEDGWIAGSNRGEWGGEFVFLPRDSKPVILLGKNAVDLHRVGDRIVALTGIAHLFINEGAVYLIERNADGQWQARPWLTLPEAPRRATPTRDGRLWVELGEGGLLISTDGRMAPVPCRD